MSNDGINQGDAFFLMICFAVTWVLIVAGIIITNEHLDDLAKPTQIERSYVSQ